MNNQTEPTKPPAVRAGLLAFAIAIGVALLAYQLVNHNGRAVYMAQESRIPGLIAVALASLMVLGAAPLAIVLVKWPRFPLLLPAVVAHLVALVGGYAVVMELLKADMALKVNDLERPFFARLGANSLSSAHSAVIIVTACIGTLSLIVMALGVLRVYSISRKCELARGSVFRLKVIGVAALAWLLLRVALVGTQGVVAVLPPVFIGLLLIAFGSLAHDGLVDSAPGREIARRGLWIASASYLVLVVAAEFAARADSFRTLLIAISGERDPSADSRLSLAEFADAIVEGVGKVHNSAFLPFLGALGFGLAVVLILRKTNAKVAAKDLLIGAVVVIPPLLIISGLGLLLSRTVHKTLEGLRDPYESTPFPAIATGGTATLCKAQPVFRLSDKELQRADGKTFPVSALDDAAGRKQVLDFGDNWELNDRVIAGGRGGDVTFAILPGVTFRGTKSLVSALLKERRETVSFEGYWVHPRIVLRGSLGHKSATLESPFEVLAHPEVCVEISVPLAPDLMDAEQGMKEKKPKPEEIGTIHLSVENWILTRPGQQDLAFTGDVTARAAVLRTALVGLKELRMTVDGDVPVEHPIAVASLAAALPDGRAVLDLSR